MKNDTQKTAQEVADQLLMEGVRPTQQNVRERMGSGSITTINKALNIWWKDLGQRLKANTSHPMLPDPVAESASKLWLQALAYAEKNLENRRSELESEYRKKLKETSQESREEQQELRDLRGQCIRLLQENERINSEKHSLQLSVAQSENHKMELQVKIDSLQRELKQSALMAQGSNIEDYIDIQVANRTLKEENKRLSKQIDMLMSEKSGLLLEIARLEQENQSFKS